MQRSPHPHWGVCHERPLTALAACTVMMFGWMECNFWMINFSSSSLLVVIHSQWYRLRKLVNIVLRCITEGSGLHHFPSVALLHVRLTIRRCDEKQMSSVTLLRFACGVAMGSNIRRMMEVKQYLHRCSVSCFQLGSSLFEVKTVGY